MGRRFGLILGGVLLGAVLAIPAVIAVAPSDTSVFVSVEPCAAFDTRPNDGGISQPPYDARVAGGDSITPNIAGTGDFTTQGGQGATTGCGIPGFSNGEAQAEAVLINLIALSATGGGNLKVWPTDGAEPTSGGVVNFQGNLSANLNNSNAVSLPLRQDSEGADITVKVNANPTVEVHVRGVVLGYWTDASNLFLDKATYDQDNDGTVDASAGVGPLPAGVVRGDYCSLATQFPETYPDAPCRWTALDLDDVGGNTAIAIGVDGYPVISYHNADSKDLKFVHCTAADCSTTDTPITLDGEGIIGDAGLYSSIAIGADGFPIISYSAETFLSMWVIHCTAIDCSTSDLRVWIEGPTPEANSESSIAIGTDGYPIISYNDETDNVLKMAHCTSTDCTSFNVETLVDESSTISDPSLAIGTDGFPIISYANNGDLKVVHCTAVDCSTNDPHRGVDTGSDWVGFRNSVAIGTDGLPIISYYDYTSETALKVVHCTAVDCSTNDTPRTLDSNFQNFCTTGACNGTSIAIGTDGYPVIGYMGGTAHQWVVRCTAADCSTNAAPQRLDFGGYGPSIAIGVDGFPIISFYDGGSLSIVRPQQP